MSTYNTAKYATVFPAHITAKHAAVCTAFWATIVTTIYTPIESAFWTTINTAIYATIYAAI